MTAPDNNGKNTGTGKGRPPAATRFQAAALLDVLAEGDLEAIYSKIIGWAKRGNLAAAALILNHGGARAAWSSRRDRPARHRPIRRCRRFARQLWPLTRPSPPVAATEFFRIPPNRVVEFGGQIEI